MTSLLALPIQLILASDPANTLFSVDIRTRVVGDTTLYVVVQVDNRSGASVTELEGFLTALDDRGSISSERKVVHIHTYDSPMRNGHTAIRGTTYALNPKRNAEFRYHISRVRFNNDARVYSWTAAQGLLRIE